jgi:hypothetical protein
MVATTTRFLWQRTSSQKIEIRTPPLRLGFWGRIAISGRTNRSVPVPIRASHGAPHPSCAERPVPVRLRQEIQAVLRRGGGELSACRSSSASYPLNLEVIKNV